ncbi:MAG: ATP-binding protein [Pyrinomonadaceae bacterium]
MASAITVAVLATVLALVSPRVADTINKEQRERAELQAINLAEQISHTPAPRDPEMLARAANLVRGSRKDLVAVRIWERVGGKYVETAAAAGSEPVEEIPEETIAALRSGLQSTITRSRPTGEKASLYRVFTPITEPGRTPTEPRRFSGAVEVVELLDDAPSLAVSFERTAIWTGLMAVLVITLATYLLFRYLVYRPIERLLLAMSRAEAGDLEVKAPQRAPDELGLLSRGFNRMIARIREMTEEREGQRRVLQERVQEATSELEQRNQQLAETNLELSQAALRLTELERLAAAGQTAAQFAHEVGTPLNLISGHVQLLRARVGDDANARTKLETISAQIERIERIVRSMLDRTRPIAPELSPLDLNALMLRTFDATAPALDARGVRLETEMAEHLPLVAGDADHLQQVFINLINNALDAMPEGGLMRVRTGVVVDEGSTEESEQPTVAPGNACDEQVFVEFADTGVGVAEELHARIFDPFYTTKGMGQGTGLGLVVVRNIVRDHGGEIEVKSEPGHGARFLIKFPAIAERSEAGGRMLVAAEI